MHQQRMICNYGCNDGLQPVQAYRAAPIDGADGASSDAQLTRCSLCNPLQLPTEGSLQLPRARQDSLGAAAGSS
jgi:hypothetical protein